MKYYDVNYAYLPITTYARNDMLHLEDHPDHPYVQNRDDIVWIIFNETEQYQCACKTRYMACKLEELKIYFFV